MRSKWVQTKIAAGLLMIFLTVTILSSCGQSDNNVYILMLTADTKAEWVETVTETFNADKSKTTSGKTIIVEVVEQGSPSEAQQAVLDGKIKPVVWSPGDISWVDSANQSYERKGLGVLVSGECPRIVYAATGFAMWQPMAEAMGWPDTPIGWSDIVDLATNPDGWAKYGHPEWGQFKFGHTHPEHSTTGFSILASLAYASLDMTEGLTPELVWSEQVIRDFHTMELNTFHYGTSTRVIMNQMAERGPSYLHAVSGSETAVLANNKYVPAPDDKLFPYVFIFPSEGTFWSDNPFCILETEWVSDEQREAAQIYRDYLLAPEQQDIAIDIGLRPANPDVPLRCPICLEYYTDPRVTTATIPPLESVSGETANAIIDIFHQTKRKATVILVLDISGSMTGQKLETAKLGMSNFIEQLDNEDEVMVMLFDDSVDVMQSLTRAGSVAEVLIGRLDSIKAGNSTALYKAVCQAKEVAEDAKEHDLENGERRLYGVVLLSDGKNTEVGIDRMTMYDSCLPQSESADVVKIFTIAYGDGADEQLLEEIAKRTYGRAFIADPDNIDEVYLAVAAEQ